MTIMVYSNGGLVETFDVAALIQTNEGFIFEAGNEFPSPGLGKRFVDEDGKELEVLQVGNLKVVEGQAVFTFSATYY